MTTEIHVHQGTGRDTATTLRIALLDVIAYWPEMVTVLAAGTDASARPGSERVDPVHAHVLDVRLDTLADLHFYARVVLDEHPGAAMPGAGLRATDAVGLARFLEAHRDFLAAHELGPVAAQDLAARARAVHAIARPAAPEDEHFVGPCRCGQRLHAVVEQQWLTCPACGETTDRAVVRAEALDVARDHCASAVEIERTSQALSGRDVTAAQVRQWARVYSGRRAHLNPEPLRARGTTLAASGRRVDTYSLGEVWDRYDAEQVQRTQRTRSTTSA